MTTSTPPRAGGASGGPRAAQGTRFWHPFADMAQVAQDELVLDRGEGVWLWDEAGNRYLDSTAALWYCNVGHGRRELADAAAVQMTRLAACSNFDRLANRPALELAERIAARAPMKDAVVFFTSGGSESVDTAAKMVRRYWAVTGKPERQTIVVREHAYHGMAGYGTSLAGIQGNYTGLGRPAPRGGPGSRGRPRGLAARVRGGRGPDRGLLRRAGHRRGRRAASGRGLLEGGRRSCATATTCCSWWTRWSPASAAWASGSPPRATASSPTS